MQERLNKAVQELDIEENTRKILSVLNPMNGPTYLVMDTSTCETCAFFSSRGESVKTDYNIVLAKFTGYYNIGDVDLFEVVSEDLVNQLETNRTRINEQIWSMQLNGKLKNTWVMLSVADITTPNLKDRSIHGFNIEELWVRCRSDKEFLSIVKSKVKSGEFSVCSVDDVLDRLSKFEEKYL